MMSIFSRDLLVNYLRYLQCLNLVNHYLHEYSNYTDSAWFLDGRTEGPATRKNRVRDLKSFEIYRFIKALIYGVLRYFNGDVWYQKFYIRIRSFTMHLRGKCTSRFKIYKRFIQSRTRFIACCGPLG